ncbi:hypothetical protein JCM5350_000506 [Sporobolomyces pararoseus]
MFASSTSSRLALMVSLLLGSTSLVKAHVELLFPPPINSKYDPQTIEANIDYSMTSPLNQDGSNFPCKGYNTAEAYKSLKPVATLKAGENFEIEFAPGGAVHGGGSCQFSVSYDQGKTFAVIYSVEGGCPLQSNYTVPIPKGLPNANSATFSWTWFNKVGNREMYQNCAIVDITGGSSSSFTGPELYRANTFEDGTCTTVEGVEPVFPNPGPAVEFGGSTTKSSKVTQLDNCKLKQDGEVTVSPSGSSSSPSTPPTSSSPSSSTASPSSSSSSSKSSSAPSSSIEQPEPTSISPPLQSKRVTYKDRTAAVVSPSSSSSSSSSSPSSSSSGTKPSPSPSSSSLIWSRVSQISSSTSVSKTTTSPSSSSSVESSASPTSLQAAVTRPPYVQRKTTKQPIRTPVRVTTTLTKTSFATATTTSTAITTSTATTTVTSSACSTAIVAEPSPTSTSGSPFTEESGDSEGGGGGGGTYLKCDTLVTFSLCDGNDSCTFMGSVAPGTECRDGKIGLSSVNRLIKIRRGSLVGVGTRSAVAAPVVNESIVKVKRGLPVHEMRRHS